MNDRRLRYAVAVWQEGSFSLAAKRLNVSQPAVSEQVRILEGELGFTLFERTGNGITVSYPGEIFLRQAEQTIADMSDLAETARRLRGEQSGSIGIGFSTGLPTEMVLRIMKCLGELVPAPRIHIVTATTRRINRFIFQKRLDIGLTIESTSRSVPSDLARERIAMLELGLLLPPDHPLAASREPVPAEDFAGEPLIVTEPNIGYGEFVGQIYSARGLTPKIAVVSDDLETSKLMVQSKVGVAIVPLGFASAEIETGRLVVRAISPRSLSALSLVRGEAPLSPRVEHCIDLIRKTLTSAQLDRSGRETGHRETGNPSGPEREDGLAVAALTQA